jgi:ferrous iron transport protein B
VQRQAAGIYFIYYSFFCKEPGNGSVSSLHSGGSFCNIVCIVSETCFLQIRGDPVCDGTSAIPCSNGSKHVWFRTGIYLKKIGGIILIASVIVWLLSNFPRTVSYSRDYEGEISAVEKTEMNKTDKAGTVNRLLMEQKSEKQGKSFMGMIGKTIEPVMKPLGFDWRLSVSILSGLAAKEVVVSTLGVIYQADYGKGKTSLVEKIQNQQYTSGKKVFTPVIAFSFMLFILTYFPCIGVVAAIRRESGSWKWAAFTVIYTTGIAWLLSFSFYQIGSLIF